MWSLAWVRSGHLHPSPKDHTSHTRHTGSAASKRRGQAPNQPTMPRPCTKAQLQISINGQMQDRGLDQGTHFGQHGNIFALPTYYSSHNYICG